MAIRGIDVSDHQGEINYDLVKADGIEFVIPRTGYGFSTVDNFFMRNVAQAKSHGVKVPAVYHFSYALQKDDAVEEAKFAIKMAEEAGLDKSTIIFYDLEYDNVDRYAKDANKNHLGKVVNIGKAKASDFAKAFCDTVEAAGYKAGIYANTDYLDRMFSSAVINRYILWHADWTGAAPKKNAMFFQKSEEGFVNGINGRVDLTDYMGDIPLGETPVETEKPKPTKSDADIVQEVIAGKWGNGNERKIRLTDAGYDYNKIQSMVNEFLKPKKKTNDEIAKEVIAGKWGNGNERKQKLEAAGYNYNDVQSMVNALLAPKQDSKVAPAMSRDDRLAGTYTVNVDALNMRYRPNVMTRENVIKILKRGDKVQNYGFYSSFAGSKWLLIQHGDQTGWVSAAYVVR